jgi:predicted transcriptional regulator
MISTTQVQEEKMNSTDLIGQRIVLQHFSGRDSALNEQHGRIIYVSDTTKPRWAVKLDAGYKVFVGGMNFRLEIH